MKATVEIPDDLFVEAKKRAAELRRPLRELIERGLRNEVMESGARGGRHARPVRLHWVTVEGGLPPGLEIADRAAMHDWLRTHR